MYSITVSRTCRRNQCSVQLSMLKMYLLCLGLYVVYLLLFICFSVVQLPLLSCSVVSVRATSPPHPPHPHTPHHPPLSAPQAPSTFSVFVASSPCLIAGVTQTLVSHHRNVSTFNCQLFLGSLNQCIRVYRTVWLGVIRPWDIFSSLWYAHAVCPYVL